MAVILASKLQFYDYKNAYIIDSSNICNGICCVKSLPQIVVLIVVVARKIIY